MKLHKGTHIKEKEKDKDVSIRDCFALPSCCLTVSCQSTSTIVITETSDILLRFGDYKLYLQHIKLSIFAIFSIYLALLPVGGGHWVPVAKFMAVVKKLLILLR